MTKEYVVLPIKDYNLLKAKENNSKEEIINKNLPAEVLLDIRENIQKSSPKLPEKRESEDYNIFLSFLPLNLRGRGKDLIENLIRMEGVSLDRYGILRVKELDQSIRIEDVLRMVLVRNASIKNNTSIAEFIIKHIPRNLILNKKVTDVKIEEQEGSGINKFHQSPCKPKRTFNLNKWIQY